MNGRGRREGRKRFPKGSTDAFKGVGLPLLLRVFPPPPKQHRRAICPSSAVILTQKL